MTDLGERDFEFQCVHGARQDVPLQGVRSIEDDNVLVNKKAPISWRCDVCGYHMLAMDHRGFPLPLGSGPRGEVIPVYCSRCEAEHTSWSQASPFDNLGDHANIRAAFSDRVNSGVPYANDALVRRAIREYAPQMAALQPSVYNAEAQRNTLQEARQAQTYACGLCGRPLHRLDADGNVVPLDYDARGNITPLECPGCRVAHSNWVLTPMAHPVRPSPSTVIGTQSKETIDREMALLQKPIRASILF